MLTVDTKAEWVETVTESFNAADFKTASGKTIFVEVMEQDSPGEARDALLAEAIQPVVWSPGYMSWVEQANQIWQDMGNGALVGEGCPRVVYAATSFAMWQPMAEAMGWPDTPIGWEDIVELATDPEGWGRYGHSERGPVQIRPYPSRTFDNRLLVVGQPGLRRPGHDRPSATIIGHAKRLNVDLIVMSSRGQSAIRRRLYGSVTEKVLCGAPCATLVVREQEPIQKDARVRMKEV
jgi:hypothetical protein